MNPTPKDLSPYLVRLLKTPHFALELFYSCFKRGTKKNLKFYKSTVSYLIKQKLFIFVPSLAELKKISYPKGIVTLLPAF